MRRATAALIVTATVATLVGAAAAVRPAVAQTTTLSLELLSQTPWATAAAPTVRVVVRVTNVGDAPVTGLSVAALLRSPVDSRTAYRQSLEADAGEVLGEVVRDAPGALAPGASREVSLAFSAIEAGASATSAGLHPMTIEARVDGARVTALRSALPVLDAPAGLPLDVAWMFFLSEPVRFLPNGTFLGDELERAVGPGGHLAERVAVLTEAVAGSRAPVVDLVLSPILLEQLRRMRGGYAVQQSDDPYDVRAVAEGTGGSRDAAVLLESLRRLAEAPTVRVSLLPYASPLLPSLVASGLDADVELHLRTGADVAREVLGIEVDGGLAVAPGGDVDAASLATLAALGETSVVVGPDSLDLPERPLGFAAPATVRVAVDGGTSITAIVPEPDLAARFASAAEAVDPILAAQALIGDVAAIWQESPDERRAVAIVVNREDDVPARFLAAVLDGLTGAPWLRTRAAEAVAGETDPAAEPATVRAIGFPVFDEGYVTALREARRRVRILSTMLPGTAQEPRQMRRALLVAEAAQFLSDRAGGAAFVTATDNDTSAMLQVVEVDDRQSVTLTSAADSVLPVVVENIAATPVRVTVRVVSQYLTGTVTEDLRLEGGEIRTLTFEVTARGGGRFPVYVEVLAPSGDVLSTTPIYVRSTQLNRLALGIVVVAAIAFVVLGLRGRRRTPA